MTDRQLLEQLANLFEQLRKLAMADGRVSRHGITIPKWRIMADECRDARERVLDHLGESP